VPPGARGEFAVAFASPKPGRSEQFCHAPAAQADSVSLARN